MHLIEKALQTALHMTLIPLTGPQSLSLISLMRASFYTVRWLIFSMTDSLCQPYPVEDKNNDCLQS